MESNNRLKSTLKGKITRLETYIKTVDNTTDLVELKVKLKSVVSLQKNIEELRGNYYAIPNIKDTDLNIIDEELNQLEDRLEKLEVRIETIINSYKESSSETVNKYSDSDNFEIKTKIPPLVLPEFSGKYEEFSSFKVHFDDLITNNKQLSQSQKLYYLRSSLTHDAKHLSSNFDNFESLYEFLENRYDNERLIVDIHVQNILNFDKIQTENAKEIRNMIDCIQKNLRALKVLKYERNKLSDVFLINILVQKLDKESRKNFELSLKSKNVPTFEEFVQFLEQRESILLSVNRNAASGNSKINTSKNFPISSNKLPKALIINENRNKNCIVCKLPHPIYRCSAFLKLSVGERLNIIRKHKLCELCLKLNHKKQNCFSQYKCVCGARHSKLICSETNDIKSKTNASVPNCKVSEKEYNSEDSNMIAQSTASVLSNSRCSEQTNKKNVLFSTAEIYVRCANNQRIKIRSILDSASNVCVLTEKMSNCLGINKQKIKTPVSGLNGLSQNIKWKLSTFISNEDCSFNEQVEFLIVDKITEFTPSSSLDISNVEIPQFLNLADKSFYEANEVHALISSDIFFKVLKHNTYNINEDLFFKESEFGWIACGKLDERQIKKQGQCFFVSNDSLQDTLKLFFDLEGLGIRDDPVFHEKDQAVEVFNETVEYKNGRYVVQLPFRKSYKELSDNYTLARQRFQNLWRRFSHDSELYQQYREIIRDYLEQGIIEEVNIEITDNGLKGPLYYLPHQAVRKEGRLTSRTRIVFDAGSHQNNELSLNDCLWPGINLNPNLIDILINFRLNRTAFCSDIKQAFLQICLAEEHKDAVRFLWSNDEPCVHKKPKLQVYRFNRVNFGVCSSPFLLAATIRYHIEKYKDDFPDTVKLLDRSFYVDDLISGGSDFEEAFQISQRAKHIMEAAGMDLRKWISNDANLMEQWKNEKFDVHPVHETIALGANQTKVLGLSWDTHEDYLTMDTRSLLEFVSIDKNTKRFILQAVGKIFDPLGLISPFTVRVKCLIQDLWSEKIQWDEPLPPHVEKEWKKWCEELPHLESLKIPRLVLYSTLQEDVSELHSFCDASKKAYGAAIYLKSKNKNGISVKLVTSKSRVAPLHGVTLPRLELLGALVAARLISKVKEIVNLKSSCVQYHWTDSKIVLFWIKGTKTRWKQFVANRVNEITNLTDPNSWYHCAGKENPADFLSRGMSADCLVTNSRWWTGPEFLTDPDFSRNFELVVPELDYLTETEKETVVQEKKKMPQNESDVVLMNNDSCNIIDSLLEISNNYSKIINILSYIFRFVYNCKNKHKKVGPLTVTEMKDAEIKLIKHAQRSLFDKKGLPSNISNLTPFVDGDGLVRVGGRLKNASVSYNQKHPAILPKGSKLCKLYFSSLHRKLFHVGPQGLLNAVRQKFWPLSGRSIARKTVHECVTCFKIKPILSSQIMGNLPSERVNISNPFTIVGLDLCGPYLVKYKYQRKGTLNKVYICVCICFSTKAIHLELLSDLSSDALIATIKRFTSRRGKCSKIYTDNATNFVGSNSKLKKFYKLINFPDVILANYFASEGIDWNFIPPKSPHFGGLWEAGVKSVKYHLKRSIGNLHFTYEEFETIMIQIEGILNSRPLTPLSSDSDSFDVLTPGHFLIGRPITSIPEPNLIGINENRLSRWEKITKVVQLIWRKWKLDYLNTLQARSKWIFEKKDLVVGQMVLIKEDLLPINNWLLGRIQEVYYGSDGKVRVVKVKTKSGEFKRAINKIAVLPIDTK